MTNWKKPTIETMAPYMVKYIDLIPDGNLIELLDKNRKMLLNLVSGLTKEQQHFRYAPGKWSVAQLLMHILDAERVFTYRILCVARGEKKVLPGFDENTYADNSNADLRNFTGILEEYSCVRNASISLLKSLDDKALATMGNSNNHSVSVNANCCLVAGHEMHHINVLKEKYLK